MRVFKAILLIVFCTYLLFLTIKVKTAMWVLGNGSIDGTYQALFTDGICLVDLHPITATLITGTFRLDTTRGEYRGAVSGIANAASVKLSFFPQGGLAGLAGVKVDAVGKRTEESIGKKAFDLNANVNGNLIHAHFVEVDSPPALRSFGL